MAQSASSFINIPEWNDEPQIIWGSYEKQPAKVVRAVHRYVGNANKTFCIIETKSRIVKFIGSMAECRQKLAAKKDPQYSMVLYHPK